MLRCDDLSSEFFINFKNEMKIEKSLSILLPLVEVSFKSTKCDYW